MEMTTEPICTYMLDPRLEYKMFVRANAKSTENRATRRTHFKLRKADRANEAVNEKCDLPGTKYHFESVQRVPLIHNSWRELVEFPRFTKRLYNQILTLGRNAQLEVHVTGFPEPEVRWYKDSLPIMQSNILKMKRNGSHVYILSLKDLKTAGDNDSGLYSCRASNFAGSDATSAYIHVEKFNSSYKLQPRDYY